MRVFGLIKGMPHSYCNEEFESYKKFKNSIPKQKIIEHMESDKVERWYALDFSCDMFTGEDLVSGLIEDGNFRFPMEFLHYYKRHDIGIPYDYEEYLKGIIDK